MYSSFTSDTGEFLTSRYPYAVTYEDGSYTEHRLPHQALRHAKDKRGRPYEWNPFIGRDCWQPLRGERTS
jgi:hypothetical protein